MRFPAGGIQPGDVFAKFKGPQRDGGAKAKCRRQHDPPQRPGQGAANGHARRADREAAKEKA